MTALAAEVRDAMTARGISRRRLAAILDVSTSTVNGWLLGRLPTLRLSTALAEALDRPNIVVLVREARTSACLICGRLRVHGSNAGRYCSKRCSETAHARKVRETDGKPGVLAQARVKIYDAAVDELCRVWCEPGGLCRDSTCPIQAAGLSPLPLADLRVRLA